MSPTHSSLLGKIIIYLNHSMKQLKFAAKDTFASLAAPLSSPLRRSVVPSSVAGNLQLYLFCIKVQCSVCSSLKLVFCQEQTRTQTPRQTHRYNRSFSSHTKGRRDRGAQRAICWVLLSMAPLYENFLLSDQ